MREAVEIKPNQKAVFVREDGAIFYVMMEPNGLWLHVAAPAGKSPGKVEFEHNAGNEGWVHCDLREPVKPNRLRRVGRIMGAASRQMRAVHPTVCQGPRRLARRSMPRTSTAMP